MTHCNSSCIDLGLLKTQWLMFPENKLMQVEMWFMLHMEFQISCVSNKTIVCSQYCCKFFHVACKSYRLRVRTQIRIWSAPLGSYLHDISEGWLLKVVCVQMYSGFILLQQWWPRSGTRPSNRWKSTSKQGWSYADRWGRAFLKKCEGCFCLVLSICRSG